ncbi:uncharacterized protein LOC134829979 [Culicoides brevitarsis]|uniref:uncharacterized protein LOC134829979 n=1 Tax=Culicoides brevitarsis TaxID=469753 RepID=UPI00307C4D3B
MKRKMILEDYGFTSNKRPKIECKISDLPNEMLREIFKNLPTKDRLIARRVCNFWMELLNKYFQDDNTLKITGFMDLSETGFPYKIFKARLFSTKAKRAFSRLLISWWPEQKYLDLINFVKLIGDEISFLKISGFAFTQKIKELYDNLPNLESLEIYDEESLGDLTFSPKLKSIKIDYKFTQLEKLPDIQKLASLEHFSTKSLVIKQNSDALASFLEPKFKKMLDIIIGDAVLESDTITLDTDFNFCGEAKFTADDVTTAQIGKNILNIAPLAKFNNLKKLELSTDYQHAVTHFTTFHRRVQFSSVVDLEFSGSGDILTNSSELLKKFPNIETLSIDSWIITDSDFLTICQNMPKLKKLFFDASTITIETLFNLNNISVKDLKLLESLSVQTKAENMSSSQLTWPTLPHLKKVSLSGDGFRYLEKNFFTQMVKKSPKIEIFEIFYATDSVENDHSKFLPIFSHLKLTKLKVPGEGGNVGLAHNTNLIDLVIKHCKNLTDIEIHDINGFSLAQELRLFRSLPKLEVITSESMATNSTCRVMSRLDSKKLKRYLTECIYDYKDLAGTISYLYNHEIPHSERIQMEKNFDSTYFDRHMKTLYIVLHDYLKLNYFNVCRILKSYVAVD